MTILLVGGGSGGHITPLLAVASRLKKDIPGVRVSVVSERVGSFNHLFDGENDIDGLRLIFAGKYRRYNSRSLFHKVTDIKTLILNVRDVFRLAVGTVQSLFILKNEKPNVIFIKGGYVGVPVGIAARILKIPYITHDSDAVPGLTNRIIGKKAVYNAVGMPEGFYKQYYPANKIKYVGVPVSSDFNKIDPKLRHEKRKELDISANDFLLLVTGGSNGAKRLDEIMHSCLKSLLEKNPKLNVVHQVGRNNEKIYEDYPIHLHSRIRVANFLQPLAPYIAASDGVVGRAGATAIAEIGHMSKPMIVVPSRYLAGGHQLRNAEVLQHSSASIILDEDEAMASPGLMRDAVSSLLTDPKVCARLGQRLHDTTKKDATKTISDLLIEVSGKNK